MLQNVLNSIRAAAYAINPETYHVTFVNSYLRDLLPEMKRGALCYEALMARNTPCERCPFSYLENNGDTHYMEVYIQKLKKYLKIDAVRIAGANGETAVVFTGYDVTKRVENEKKLHRMAFFDFKFDFNLKNQTAFMQDIEQRTTAGKLCFVFVGRLKNLQHYNLVFGRESGDTLLKQLIKYYFGLYQSDKIYRIGGTKITFIADTEEERIKMQELMEHPFSKEMERQHKNFRPYIDFVEIEVPKFAHKTEQVIHNAEYALSKTRFEDKNHILYFTEKENLEMQRRKKIIKILNKNDKSFLERGFQVYYQPIYHVKEKRFSKCEALLRFYDKELGWVSPMEFIPIAEENGSISQLGKFVLEQACLLLAKREKEHLPPVQVNVNVSAIEFASENFYEGIEDTITKYQINPKLLHFEITESIMMNSFAYIIIDIMNKIIALGIGFSIDDFGTGYASFGYIGALPLQGIKIDKTFIDHMIQSDVHMRIVNNVVKFAKELQLNIVAEGVEELEQYHVLERLGCDYIQGYVFSKPLPEQAFFEFLTKNESV